MNCFSLQKYEFGFLVVRNYLKEIEACFFQQPIVSDQEVQRVRSGNVLQIAWNIKLAEFKW